MAQKDWIEIIDKFNILNSTYINDFLFSNESFAPSENFHNIFDNDNPYNNFSSINLKKSKPGNWIPIYKEEDLSEFLLKNNLMPIRSGQGEFFFYKGNVFFELNKVDFENIDTKNLKPIENFIPLSLKVDFQRNENAFLNKAVSLGIISHFVGTNDLKIIKKEIYNKNNKRLLYGQFGKIKTTFDLIFKTSKNCKIINKGFQFEIDLVLESKNEIFIFEAKSGDKFRNNFSLLQLYYPLIYFQFITLYRKKIRTIFIDIVKDKNKEIYRLVEFEFKNNNIDKYKVLNTFQYEILNDNNYLLEEIINYLN